MLKEANDKKISTSKNRKLFENYISANCTSPKQFIRYSLTISSALLPKEQRTREVWQARNKDLRKY